MKRGFNSLDRGANKESQKDHMRRVHNWTTGATRQMGVDINSLVAASPESFTAPDKDETTNFWPPEVFTENANPEKVIGPDKKVESEPLATRQSHQIRLYQDQLDAFCVNNGLTLPSIQLLSNRRGGRTAWTAYLDFEGQRIEAGYWYDRGEVDKAREEVAYGVLQRYGQVPAVDNLSSGPHGFQSTQSLTDGAVATPVPNKPSEDEQDDNIPTKIDQSWTEFR